MESNEDLLDITASLEYYQQDYPFGIAREIFTNVQQNCKLENPKVNPKSCEFLFLIDISAQDSKYSDLRGFLDQIISKGLKLNSGSYQVIESGGFKSEDIASCSKLVVTFGLNNCKKIFPEADFQNYCNKIISIGGVDILVAEKLLDIQNNPIVKKQFWEVLKNYA